MSNQNEKKIDDDEFIRNLDKSSILSGDESEDEEENDNDIEEKDEDEDNDEKDDEEFKESLDTEFPLSGGETEL